MNNLLMTMKVNGKSSFNSVEEHIVENQISTPNCTNTRSKTTTHFRDNFIFLLDRFEILYGDKVTNLRRFYNDGHLLDLLRITGKEDLRRFVEEKINWFV